MALGADALTEVTTISITTLSQADVSALDEGMTNTTSGPQRGYRFLPHNQRFASKIQVRLPYDSSTLPSGLTEQDLWTYYLDDQLGTWQTLERVRIDTQAKMVVSLTDHFTDMINTAVTAPDHPQPQAYNPNSIKDMKAADPGAGIDVIEAPRANNTGDARLAYPIALPPGRDGMQPQLSLGYDSSAGNGWLGLGWDLSVPAIAIDTRWGVPRYDGALETETYTLSGEQLTPLAHRGPLQARSSEKTFHTRVETQFQQITRHGSDPSTYWWEVTDKSGVRFFYGGTPAGPDPSATLRDAGGHVFRWALLETRDPHLNGVRYTYDLVADTGVAGGSVPGYQLYLKSVNYTQSNGAAGAYTVTFIRDSSTTATVFPELVRVDRRYFEGTPAPAKKSTYTTTEYDLLGNVARFFDAADSGTQDDVEATFEYSSCPATYIFDVATKINVTSNGALLRQREGVVDCATGNLTQVRQLVDPTHVAVSDFAYFSNGNLKQFTGPTNARGQRFTLSYEYDAVVQTHIASITDSFGYRSTASFNLKYGLPETNTDVSNNTTSYSYDVFGRTAAIRGPYQQGSGTPTIRFEYHPEAAVPCAISRHFDPFRDASGADTIDTVVFVDGLKRVLQTKRDATVHTGADTPAQDVMIVSGRLTLDLLGRTVEQFHPLTEALGTAGKFNTSYDSVTPTRTVYDVLDRPTLVTLPDGTNTTTAYGFGADRDGALQFEIAATDPNSVQKKTYRDVRSVVTALKEVQPGRGPDHLDQLPL